MTKQEQPIATKDSEDLLTVAQVAKKLGVHHQTVRKWARNGLLPILRLGKAVRFHPRDIASYIESSRC